MIGWAGNSFEALEPIVGTCPSEGVSVAAPAALFRNAAIVAHRGGYVDGGGQGSQKKTVVAAGAHAASPP